MARKDVSAVPPATGEEDPNALLPRAAQEEQAAGQGSESPPAEPAAVPADAPPEAPQFYIAEQPLFVGGAEAMPARAFNPGDRVAADLVEANQWHHLVRGETAAPAAEAQPEPDAAAAPAAAEPAPAAGPQQQDSGAAAAPGPAEQTEEPPPGAAQ